MLYSYGMHIPAAALTALALATSASPALTTAAFALALATQPFITIAPTFPTTTQPSYA